MDKDMLKKKLHEQIDAMDDEMALQMLHDAAVDYNKAEDVRDDLTPGQLEGIRESIQQLENGQWKSHEEVMKLAQTWLHK